MARSSYIYIIMTDGKVHRAFTVKHVNGKFHQRNGTFWSNLQNPQN